MVVVRSISENEISAIVSLQEGHFLDLKGKELSPAKFSKAFSAFANASGGEIYIGIEEMAGPNGKERTWDGFDDMEQANPFFQVLHDLDPLGSGHDIQFLRAEKEKGLVLHLTISKIQSVVCATDGKVYIRSNASSLPVNDQALERLKYDKGIV